jgi:hypothetical protein
MRHAGESERDLLFFTFKVGGSWVASPVGQSREARKKSRYNDYFSGAKFRDWPKLT